MVLKTGVSITSQLEWNTERLLNSNTLNELNCKILIPAWEGASAHIFEKEKLAFIMCFTVCSI